MKKIIHLSLLLLAMSMSFSSCELFGDDEHCLNTTSESKIWTPSSDPPVGYFLGEIPPYKPFGVTFSFARINNYTAFYIIDNACPYNAINLDIKVKTVPGAINELMTMKVAVFKITTVKGKKAARQMFLKIMNKKTDSDFFFNEIIEVGGLLENGPAEFAVICAATGYQSISNPYFNDVLAIENWAKQNIIKVEYKADYIKWQ